MKIMIVFLLIFSVDFVQNVVSFVSDASGTGYTQHGQVSQLHYQLHISLFERVPVCVACNAVISVKHILIECSDLLEIRKKYFEVISLYSLFRDVCL